MLFHISLVAGVNDKPLQESVRRFVVPDAGPVAALIDVTAVVPGAKNPGVPYDAMSITHAALPPVTPDVESERKSEPIAPFVICRHDAPANM